MADAEQPLVLPLPDVPDTAGSLLEESEVEDAKDALTGAVGEPRTPDTGAAEGAGAHEGSGGSDDVAVGGAEGSAVAEVAEAAEDAAEDATEEAGEDVATGTPAGEVPYWSPLIVGEATQEIPVHLLFKDEVELYFEPAAEPVRPAGPTSATVPTPARASAPVTVPSPASGSGPASPSGPASASASVAVPGTPLRPAPPVDPRLSERPGPAWAAALVGSARSARVWRWCGGSGRFPGS